MREDVARATENYELTRDIVRSEAKQFGERLDETVKAAEDSVGILDRDRITLGLIALAGHERDTILARVRERTITARMAEQVLSDADRLIEGAQAGGRSGYQLAARRSVAYGKVFRLAVMLRNRLRLPAPLGRMTADRFELLLSQRLILRDLSLFIDNRIVRIHGRRVADLCTNCCRAGSKLWKPRLRGCACNIPAMPRSWNVALSVAPRCALRNANTWRCAKTG